MKKHLLTACIFFLSHISSYSQCDSTQIVNQEYICYTFLINAFTPNNDGLNDYLSFNSNCEISNINNLKIYNSFVGLIFETNDVKQKMGWLLQEKALFKWSLHLCNKLSV